MTFGDNGRGNIISCGKIGKDYANSIENVYLTNSLKYNLLSISLLCHFWFDESQCDVNNVKPNDIMLHGSRLDNVYPIRLHHVSLMHMSYLKAFLMIHDFKIID